MILVEIVIVCLLIVMNGFLAMSELAIVSARRGRLQALANAGNPGAERAITLAANPGRFLSTVQIGITMAGVLAGAFSGATIADQLSVYLESRGVPDTLSDTLAFGAIVTAITYLSLIFGELVPKQIALKNAERAAAAVAGAMAFLSRLAGPLVYVLDVSSALVLRLLGKATSSEPQVTEEEIKLLVAEAESAGVVEPAERSMIASIMRLGDRPVKALMTPRHDVDWLDLSADDAAIRATILRSPHSRIVVARGSIDEVEGILRIKDVLDALLQGHPIELASLIRKAPAFHDGVSVLDVIEVLRSSDVKVGLVVDEYGTLEGIVTRTDILSAIAGGFLSPEEAGAPVQRADGSWLFDGGMSADEMTAILGIPPRADGQSYQTVAGLFLFHMGRLPRPGERVQADGWTLEVVDMDGRRIDKILATRPQSAASKREASIGG